MQVFPEEVWRSPEQHLPGDPAGVVGPSQPGGRVGEALRIACESVNSKIVGMETFKQQLIFVYSLVLVTEDTLTVRLEEECALHVLVCSRFASPPVPFSSRFLKGYYLYGPSVTPPAGMFRGSTTWSPLSLSSSFANTQVRAHHDVLPTNIEPGLRGPSYPQARQCPGLRPV